jgi:hypothetical protein
MVDRCRYADLVNAAALLAMVVVDIPEPCDQIPEYTSLISTDDEGFVNQIWTPVCPVHEAHVSTNAHFIRSIKLRDREAFRSR